MKLSVTERSQFDVNLANEETAEVSIYETPTGERVLYINVNGINLLRLYSGNPIILEHEADACITPLGRTHPAKRYSK